MQGMNADISEHNHKSQVGRLHSFPRLGPHLPRPGVPLARLPVLQGAVRVDVEVVAVRVRKLQGIRHVVNNLDYNIYIAIHIKLSRYIDITCFGGFLNLLNGKLS